MTSAQTSEVSAPAEGRRAIIYAISRAKDRVDDYVFHALRSLRPFGERLVAVVPNDSSPGERRKLAEIADDLVEGPSGGFDPASYDLATRRIDDLDEFDEVVLTGDSWFGPVCDLTPVLSRMSSSEASVWSMVETTAGPPESFADAGFPATHLPWSWVLLRRDVFGSTGPWRAYWDDVRPSVPDPWGERSFLDSLRQSGLPIDYAFPADTLPSGDAPVFAADALLDAGCPFLSRAVFLLYPPYLDRFAVIGREILQHVGDLGFPMDMVWQNLARTVAPKALYAIGGMLEVLPDEDVAYDPSRPLRIAVIVHVTDLDRVATLFTRIDHLPSPYDLFVTTTDGSKAANLQRLLEKRSDERLRTFEVRVTPANRGRDMSDFFVGCRDVLLSGDFDVIVKVHSRRTRDKTVNVRRYFRRYQYENLLDSPGYVANLLALFQREPGLGVVYPPMMHIGYSLMGRAWADLRDPAKELAHRLGIAVPFDEVSPLAPFGGMWVVRPEALLLLSRERWRFRDYSRRGGQRYRDLAKVQERLLSYAAAELGYHTRTVLTREHASISHTMLESKTDNLFSTTRGWPVEQIQMLQRGGYAGHFGIVALARMYIRINHPRLARMTMPLFDIAGRTFVAVKYLRRGLRRLALVVRGKVAEAAR
ncbi:rhamnan synthesis F family protein [Microbacterium sp. AZCO]|uniref:rhamnan synthesis F family protein n=1 Tax=Microbacterium sp. AZCO TaxID=3142976 RepID=UPI0031F42249